ncbi:hemagglutinin repeat-containing protein, partial [Moraxella marmotae]|uniref:hemagglutinin repeat-containing protein n=1 Tax=Moraxella marmotae TaxID=3344520 RepID=UPI0035F4AEEB
MDSNTSIQSTVGGENVMMRSGGDVKIVATKVLADRDVTLVSDGKISIDAGANHQSIHRQSTVKKSGLVDISPTSLTVGRQTADQASTADLQTYTGSTVAALGGDVTIVANQSYQQTGSDVLAFKPDNANTQTAQARSVSEGGNVDIFARSINVENATESQTTTNDFRFKQSGVSVAISNPIIDWGMQAHNMYQAAKQTDDERSKRLAALSVAGDGWMTWSEYKEQKNQTNKPNSDKKGNNTLTDFKVTATIGSQSSQANSTGYQESNKASNIKAENVTLHAFGEKDGDINIVGSQVIGKNSTALTANNDINILSSTQSQYSTSNNKNSSTGIGAYISVGADTSFGLTASGGIGRGNTNTSGQTQTNSQVSAGNLLILDSINDTNIKGGTARAEQVLARVGGDLNIHSRLDSYQLEGKQRQYGGAINMGLGTKMPVSGSVSAELGDSHVNYHAVREQSGIYAGKDGFDITVGGNTDLLGAVIASEATRDKNKLATTTFSHADIINVSEAKSTVKSYGLDSQVFSGNLYPLAKTIIANTIGNQGSDVNYHKTSQTISAIADGELVASDTDSQAHLDVISHDTQNAHQYIAPANIDEMMADAKAQQFIKDATVDTLFKYSDEAHRKMFIAEAPLYRVTKDEKGNLVFTQIKGKEKENLLRQQDNQVHTSTNGIFNDAMAAGGYAVQNRRDKLAKLGQELDLNQEPVYFVHFPKTNNALSEMMVAAYQKFLESDTL